MMIWKKYCVREFFTVFTLFVFCFYGLYVLIDYSSHSSIFHSIRFTNTEILLYYLYILVQRLDIIIPFGVLLATIKTLTNLNVHNELTALMASGIPLKRLMRPFLFFAFLFTVVLYLNDQFILLKSVQGLQEIQDAHFAERYNQKKKDQVKYIALKNDGLLIYNNYDSSKKEFSDVYFIKSIDQIYRIQTLSMNKKKPIGKWVDRIDRQSDGKMILTDSNPVLEFPELSINKKMIQEAVIPPNSLGILQLWEKLPSEKTVLNERDAKIATSFARKIAMPWLCLLAFLGPAPFCLRFSRHLPIFYIYLWSMFGLIAFYLLLNAATILGESQVFPPLVAIWAPFGVLLAILVGLYARKI